MDLNQMDDLMLGYFNGDLNLQETERLRHWLAESDEHAASFNHFREIWESSAIVESSAEFDKNRAYQRFASRKSVVVATRKKRIFHLAYRAAAIAIFFLMSVTAAFWLGQKNVGDRLDSVVVEAPFGSQTKTYLPDGSLVWLNAGSKISYSQSFGLKNREVQLVGEGYFEVTKSKDMPFSVKTKEMEIKVLGTKFNVRNYDEEEDARVALLEGSVCVQGDFEGRQVYLVPNRQVIVDKQTRQTKVTDVRSACIHDWTNGVLFFDEEKLSDIAKELSRIYNVNIVVVDDIDSYRFFGNFVRTEQPIEEVLDVLASTNKLQYKITGKNITIAAR